MMAAITMAVNIFQLAMHASGVNMMTMIGWLVSALFGANAIYFNLGGFRPPQQNNNNNNNNVIVKGFKSASAYLIGLAIAVGVLIAIQYPLWSTTMVCLWGCITAYFGIQTTWAFMWQGLWTRSVIVVVVTAIFSAIIAESIQKAYQAMIHAIKDAFRWVGRKIWDGMRFSVLFLVWHGPVAILTQALKLAKVCVVSLWNRVKGVPAVNKRQRPTWHEISEQKQQQQQRMPQQPQQQPQQQQYQAVQPSLFQLVGIWTSAFRQPPDHRYHQNPRNHQGPAATTRNGMGSIHPAAAPPAVLHRLRPPQRETLATAPVASSLVIVVNSYAAARAADAADDALVKLALSRRQLMLSTGNNHKCNKKRKFDVMENDDSNNDDSNKKKMLRSIG